MNSITGTSASSRQLSNDNDDTSRKLSVPETNDSFDFVLIEADEGVFHGIYKMDDDDDSYDYCEDACSMLSNNEDSSSDNSLMDMKDSVLSVPEVLMKDLDEAHAAAKLVQFNDDDDDPALQDGEGRSTTSSPRKPDHFSTASSVVSMEEEEDDDEDASPKNEDSSLLANKNTVGTDEVMEDQSTRSPDRARPPKPVSSLGLTTQVTGEHKRNKAVSATDPSASTKEGTSSISRTSNKKRRKKLKMLKKAQAAASASMKLAEKKGAGTTGSCCTSTAIASSKKAKVLLQQSQATKSRSSKKIANIAVACATESMAAYRQELILRSIK